MKLDREPRVGDFVTNGANPHAVIQVVGFDLPGLFLGRAYWTDRECWARRLSTHMINSAWGWETADPPPPLEPCPGAFGKVDPFRCRLGADHHGKHLDFGDDWELEWA